MLRRDAYLNDGGEVQAIASDRSGVGDKRIYSQSITCDFMVIL